MKRLLTAMTAISALAAAAPAAAQYGAQANMNAGGAAGIQNRIAQIEARIQAGTQSGVIDRTEARNLRQNVRALSRLERQYSRDGLTQAERQTLQQRLRALRQEVRLADGGRNDRYTSWNDEDYRGQGGPLEEVDCQSRGIGGIIGNILGNRDGDCGFRVGQRVTGNLSAVPYQYRNQFRDDNGIYYRTDGRMIYQIDARTNTVLRVYSAER